MLYREALLGLGEAASRYVSELSRRPRAHLREEVLALYALGRQHGPAALVEAMQRAERHGAYGAAYLRALLALPTTPPPAPSSSPLRLVDGPAQAEIDRALSTYEAYVRISEAAP